MYILGIDPGYATIGYGVIHYHRGKCSPIRFGAITTPPNIPFPSRLEMIYQDMQSLLSACSLQHAAVEQLFFAQNKTTGIDVSQARGVILLALQQLRIPIGEYKPSQVKSAVAGYGKAEKHQVMEMTRQILGLPAIPTPDDTADALALAICHAHTLSGGFFRRF